MTKTAMEKFLTNVWITLVARATLLLAPLALSFVTWFTWEVYSRMEQAIAQQAQAIVEIQKQLQDHEFRLDSGRQARVEFQSQAVAQYGRFDEKLESIAEKLTETNNAVIRLQTIIENRLPPSAKESQLWRQQ